MCRQRFPTIRPLNFACCLAVQKLFAIFGMTVISRRCQVLESFISGNDPKNLPSNIAPQKHFVVLILVFWANMCVTSAWSMILAAIREIIIRKNLWKEKSIYFMHSWRRIYKTDFNESWRLHQTYQTSFASLAFFRCELRISKVIEFRHFSDEAPVTLTTSPGATLLGLDALPIPVVCSTTLTTYLIQFNCLRL